MSSQNQLHNDIKESNDITNNKHENNKTELLNLYKKDNNISFIKENNKNYLSNSYGKYYINSEKDNNNKDDLSKSFNRYSNFSFNKENNNKVDLQNLDEINFKLSINKENNNKKELSNLDEINNNISINKENSKQNDSISYLSQSIMYVPIFSQLIEFGYEKISSQRMIQYFHPLSIDEALDYFAIIDGIIQHRFIQDRNKNNLNCYICGEKKEIHIGYIPNDFSNINNNSIKSSNIKSIESENITINLEKNNIKKIVCPICSDSFISNNENTVNKCGHSYCDSCWYDFLSTKIEENKFANIKCLDYECKEKLSDVFIINLLNNKNDLIEKYKKYKFELEIMKNPNKKFCPFPNCDSYLEQKDINEKNVTCLNNHTFCFLCLQKPHGKLGCNEKLDNSIIEFAKNNFVKKCPNCGIITEKNEGCNHIICSKCNYQWCWLCNEEYNENHYNQGKCKGFQFFKPNDEYDIKLAFEGKIDLRSSQIQEDLNVIFDEIRDRPIHINRDRNMNYFEVFSFTKTLLIFLMYILCGHSFYFLLSMENDFMRNNFIIFLICTSYFFLEIANFFFWIYFNLIMLIPYLISEGFLRFIYSCCRITHFTKLTVILNKTILIFLTIFFEGFIFILKFEEYFRSKISRINYLIAAIYLIIFFPLQFIINIILIIFILIKGNFFSEFNELLNIVFGKNFKINEDD